MKNLSKLRAKQSELNQETDIQESLLVVLRKKGPGGRRGTQKGRRELEKLKRTAHHIRIMRFQLKKVKKTLRVPCYQEEELNLPVRFTRLLNQMEVDNDVETDEEVVQAEVERCTGWLKEAIRTNSGGHH